MPQDAFNRFTQILALGPTATPDQLEEMRKLMHEMTPDEQDAARDGLRQLLVNMEQAAAERGKLMRSALDGEVKPN
jgi:hypothetical protein